MPKRKYELLTEQDLITGDEKWTDLPGYEKYFLISENGVIISKKRTCVCKNGIVREKSAHIVKPNLKKNGYVYVTLRTPTKNSTKRLHRLVAEAFIENPNNLPQVNHIDGNKQNNIVSNLEWCSQSQNVLHAYNNNLIKHYTRPILKLDIETEKVLEEYESLNSAASSFQNKNVESTKNCIYLCCKGRIKFAYGYKWKYKTERFKVG